MVSTPLPGPSEQTRSLYLGTDRAGVAWLLDPASEEVAGLARRANRRSSEDACDADGLAADLDDLAVLLTERHFGVVDGVLALDPALDVLDRWQDRLRRERPRSWGEALGTSVHELRWLFHDNHLWAAGEDLALLRRVDPRAHEPRLPGDDGPIVETGTVDDVLCVRLRQCGGGGKAGETLIQQWQHDHGRHFEHDRIVVDLRGNPGGGDSCMIGWIRDHVRHDVTWPTWREWRVGTRPLNGWNYAVYVRPERGTSLSAEFDSFELSPASHLQTVEDPLTIDAAERPWRGRMLVLTDRGSASAAESATWMLRTGFDAKVVGGRSSGAVGFGNLAPYLLPRSGLKIDLPTASSGWYTESMTGMPIDLAYDVQTPLAEVAHDFDTVYADASG